MADKKPAPLPVNGKEPPTGTPVETTDVTERFIAEHPVTPETTPAPEVHASEKVEPPVADAPTADAPQAVEPSAKPSTTPPSTLPPKPREEAVAAKPTDPVTQPQPKVFDANEKYALDDKTEWTRGQLIAALQEREQIRTQLPTVQAEAAEFKGIFGEDIAAVKDTWVPILTRLQEPEMQEVAQAVLDSSPDKLAYLAQCASFFDTTVAPGSQPAARPAQPAADPEMARQIKELNAWRETQVQREQTDAMHRDYAQATQRYPMLATDANLRTDLVLTAQALYQQAKAQNFPQGNRPWLLDALALKASIYDALRISREQQNAPDPNAVSGILGTTGAAPDAARPRAVQRKKFATTDEAVDAFVHDVPADRFS
jgi:hypothetical protein